MRKLLVASVAALTVIGFLYARTDDTAPADTDTNDSIEAHTSDQGDEAQAVTLVDSSADERSDAAPPEHPTVVVRWRDSGFRDFVFPNGTPRENYQYYKSLAEGGNGFAAYQLANMMSSCSGAFMTKSDLEEAIAQVRATFTFVDPEQRTVRLGEPAQVDEHVEGMILHFDNCKGFSKEERKAHGKWLELSANHGHTTAMLEYGGKLDDPVAALELFRAAWRQGDSFALLAMADALQKTYDQGIDPNAKAPAYVAMHAYVTLLHDAFGADPDRVVGRWTLRNQAKLDEMAKSMLPEELETAVEQARQLITSNQNCCISI